MVCRFPIVMKLRNRPRLIGKGGQPTPPPSHAALFKAESTDWGRRHHADYQVHPSLLHVPPPIIPVCRSHAAPAAGGAEPGSQDPPWGVLETFAMRHPHTTPGRSTVTTQHQRHHILKRVQKKLAGLVSDKMSNHSHCADSHRERI